MAVPLRVLWNLKISRIEKFSIGLIFMVGLITMATAIIRSVTLNSSSSTGQVSTTWLMLVCHLRLYHRDGKFADNISQWAGIEGAVAIIVGCLPSFAVFIRGRVAASKGHDEGNSNQPSDYNSQPKSHERAASLGSQDPNPLWGNRDNSSDKSLVEGIVVTRTWTQKWHNPDKQQPLQRDAEAGHELRPIQP